MSDPDPDPDPDIAANVPPSGALPSGDIRARIGALSQAAPANRQAAKSALESKTAQDIANIEDTIKAIRAAREGGGWNLPLMAFGAGMLKSTPGVASNFAGELSQGVQSALPQIAAGRQREVETLGAVGNLQQKIADLRRKPEEAELAFQDKLSIEAVKLIAQMDAAGLRSNRPIQVPTTGEVVFPNYFGPGKHGFSSPAKPGVIQPYDGDAGTTPPPAVPATAPQYDPNDPIPFLQKVVHPDIKPGVWSGGDPKWDELAKIAQADPEYAQKLWKVLNYELDPTKITDMRRGKDIGPHSMNRYVTDALKIDPNWTPGGYENVKKGRESWMGTGANAKSVVSLQTGINHIGEFMASAAALENGDNQLFNRMKNWAATQSGQPAPTEFAAGAKFVGDELAKFLSGSGTVAEGSKEEIARIFGSPQSPAQLQGSIRRVIGYLEGKAKPLADQKTIDYGNRRKFDFNDLLGDSKHVVEKVNKYDITTPEGQKAWGVTPKEKTWPVPGPAAINMLKKNKDIDVFNSHYGPGAAEKILGGQ